MYRVVSPIPGSSSGRASLGSSFGSLFAFLRGFQSAGLTRTPVSQLQSLVTDTINTFYSFLADDVPVRLWVRFARLKSKEAVFGVTQTQENRLLMDRLCLCLRWLRI